MNKFFLRNISVYFFVYIVLFVLLLAYNLKTGSIMDMTLFFFLPSLFVAVKYGSIFSIYLVFLSCITSGVYFRYINGVMPDFYTYSEMFFLSFLVILIGDISGLNIHGRWKAEGRLNETQAKYKELTENYFILNRAYEELTRKMLIINARVDSIFNDFKLLKQCDIDTLFSEILLFFNRHNYVNESIIFLKKEGKYILVSSHGVKGLVEKKLEVINSKLFNMTIENKAPVSIKELLDIDYESIEKNDPVLCVPFVHGDDVIGVMVIYSISFVYLNSYNLSLIDMMCDLLGDLIYEKVYLPKSGDNNYFYKDIGVYSGSFFYERLNTYSNNIKKFPGYVFSVLFIYSKDKKFDIDKLKILKEVLFSTDFVAVLDDDAMLLGMCLNLMPENTFDIFREKLRHALKKAGFEEADFNMRFFTYHNTLDDVKIPLPGEILDDFNSEDTHTD
ncbi:MAG: hypothetical protein C0601_10790 [Candidatus Muiribacterium halophilum]|uniref:Uncharacterized protein n=1 Tax=Muiribacterium halophilum TaxID=2053465 RepID=A0A2N5ZBP1_MUIH1|nr:MAG: hypothetical protein C0601_10790 [Candidatus Muirbacterium halophilum]